jgi:hypothetical protein
MENLILQTLSMVLATAGSTYVVFLLRERYILKILEEAGYEC